MYAIISISPNTEDVMDLCATKYPHMSYLNQLMNLPQRGTSDFKTNLTKTKAVIPSPQISLDSYEEKFGDDLVEKITSYDELLVYLSDNRAEWVEDQDE